MFTAALVSLTVVCGASSLETEFKEGKRLYEAGQLDEAERQFRKVIALDAKELPAKPELARTSVLIILDIYNQQGRHAEMAALVNGFRADPRLAQGEVKQTLEKLDEALAYEVLNKLVVAEEHAKAAEGYRQFAAERPKSDRAAEALYNAAVMYGRVDRLDEAVAMLKALLAAHPRAALAAKARYDLGQVLHKLGRSEEAAAEFELYFAGYRQQKGKGPYTEPLARESLYNAVLLWEEAGKLEKSLEACDRYLGLSRDRETDVVFQKRSSLHQRMGYGKRK